MYVLLEVGLDIFGESIMININNDNSIQIQEIEEEERLLGTDEIEGMVIVVIDRIILIVEEEVVMTKEMIEDEVDMVVEIDIIKGLRIDVIQEEIEINIMIVEIIEIIDHHDRAQRNRNHRRRGRRKQNILMLMVKLQE